MSTRSWQLHNGARTAATRLARETGTSPSTANRECRRARKTVTMPLATTALASGDISVDVFDALARCNTGRLRAFYARDEAVLLEQVRHLCFEDLRRVLQRWRQIADDAGERDRVRRQHDSRHAHASRSYEGMVDVSALLDPVAGDIVLTELHRIERILYDRDRREARERLGRDPHLDELARTPSQRRADAFVEIATRSSARPDGTPAARPLFTILWGADSFRAALCETDRGILLQLWASRTQLVRATSDGFRRWLPGLPSDRRRCPRSAECPVRDLLTSLLTNG